MAGTNPRARPNNRGTPGNKGGRPEGASNRLQRYQVAEIVKSKKAPLDVMLRNMWFWDEAAENMRQRIDDTMLEMANNGANEETLDKMKELMKNFLSARDKAQVCAVDAAPYVHAKFQSIMMQRPNEKVREVTLTLPSTRVSEKPEDRSYRDGYGEPVPIRKSASS